MGFRDHFSGHAEDYSRYRPDYPAELLSYLAGLAPGRALAWDCATGNGQAASGLAWHFRGVIATDASARQIAEARPCEGVLYALALAERAPIAGGAVDLVTVAQALHWLDRPGFYAEARRVARPVTQPVDSDARCGTSTHPARARSSRAGTPVPARCSCARARGAGGTRSPSAWASRAAAPA